MSITDLSAPENPRVRQKLDWRQTERSSQIKDISASPRHVGHCQGDDEWMWSGNLTEHCTL